MTTINCNATKRNYNFATPEGITRNRMLQFDNKILVYSIDQFQSTSPPQVPVIYDHLERQLDFC